MLFGQSYAIEGRVLSKSTFYTGRYEGKIVTFVAISVKPDNEDVAKSYVVCQGSDSYVEQFMPGQNVKATLTTGRLCDKIKTFKQIGIFGSSKITVAP